MYRRAPTALRSRSNGCLAEPARSKNVVHARAGYATPRRVQIIPDLATGRQTRIQGGEPQFSCMLDQGPIERPRSIDHNPLVCWCRRGYLLSACYAIARKSATARTPEGSPARGEARRPIQNEHNRDCMTGATGRVSATRCRSDARRHTEARASERKREPAEPENEKWPA